MEEKIYAVIHTADRLIWGIPLITAVMLCGLVLTVRTKGIQLRRLGRAFRLVTEKDSGDGEVTSFGALCTSLSATIGTGNIVGVATAVKAGGPGALFWMEAAAVLGMAVKYAEGLLAVKYRTKDDNGHILGGPFYYIEKGLGHRYVWLAKLFSLFGMLAGVFGIGTAAQINGIVSAVNGYFGESGRSICVFGHNVTAAAAVTGAAVTLCAAMVMIGGIKSISRASQAIVPFMAGTYIICAVIMTVTHIREIPAAVCEIVRGAFGIRSVAGAGAGNAVMLAMRNGIARGIFSNEAGLGSAPIAAASAKTDEPVKQGLVSMTATFIDTICICTMTGLAVVISGAWKHTDMQGAEITAEAFRYGLPFSEKVCSAIPAFCLIIFAFTTILGWSYYSERCISYLLGGRACAAKLCRILSISALAAAPYITSEAVWETADIFNGLMAVPNIIAIAALSGVTAAETRRFFSHRKAEKPRITAV